MTWDEWLATNEPELPTGFECIGNERMRQVWNASAEAEREACASECETEALIVTINGGEEYNTGRKMGATVCANAIRARRLLNYE